MKKRRKNADYYFDERENAIRNRVITHGFILLVVLLFIDWFLDVIFEVHWAQGRNGNLVLLSVASFIVMLEMIFRGVYFSRKQSPYTLPGRLALMLLWAVAWGFNAGMSCITIVRLGEPFTVQGQLTPEGSNLIACTLLALSGLCGAVKSVIELYKSRRENKQQDEDRKIKE